MPSTYADLLETLREEASYGLDIAFLEDDARMLALLARTADRIARDAEVYALAIGFTPVAGQREYPLAAIATGVGFSRRVAQVLGLSRDGAEFRNLAPIAAYRLAPSSTPGVVRKVYTAPESILLDPTPTVGEAARVWTASALVLPDLPTADGTNAPNLPDELAELVPMMALGSAARRAMQGEQFARIKAAMDEAAATIAGYRARSRAARYAIREPRTRMVAR